MFVFCPQASSSTPLSSSAGSESVHRGRHYHPGLPTASQGLLQLYHRDAPEDLGPKAVSSSPKTCRHRVGPKECAIRYHLSFPPPSSPASPSADEGEDERGGMEHPFLRVWSRCLYVSDLQNQRTCPQRDPRVPERRAVAAVLWSVFIQSHHR